MNSQLRLNLGCGPLATKGWLNYDWGALPLLAKLTWVRKILIRSRILPSSYGVEWPPFELVDIRKKFPLEDSTVEFIYCSHVLEHFERWQGLHILKESHRVLKPQGRIRIVVPDLKIICKKYLEEQVQTGSSDQPAKNANLLLWGHPKEKAPQSWLEGFSRKFIRGHEWIYDQAEMKALLTEAGFREIQTCRFQEGVVPDLDKLDLESHAPYSLYMEAVKS